MSSVAIYSYRFLAMLPTKMLYGSLSGTSMRKTGLVEVRDRFKAIPCLSGKQLLAKYEREPLAIKNNYPTLTDKGATCLLAFPKEIVHRLQVSQKSYLAKHPARVM